MYAHTSERNWESDSDVPEECLELGCRDIAYQLVMNNPGRHFKVFNSDNLPEYLLGLFQDDHMAYHLKASNQPTLEEMVEVAIKMLNRSPRGYFLFVEGGRIDHAHHDSLAHLALDETVEYAKAVKKAKELTDPEETLIVVTSDHAHTMTVAGYPSRGNDILGTVDTTNGDDGKPYTTISYANGRGKSIGDDGTRVDVTLHQAFMARDVSYAYPGLVPLDSETHGGEDVAVFTLGPWQHLFTASYEQNLIPHLMAHAMCLTEDQHKNSNTKGGNFFDEKNKDHWNMQAQWTLRAKLSATLNTNIAKNVIFFLGDGMSVTTLAATRVYLGQKYGHTGEEIKLSFETFPYTGLSKTYCIDHNVADSACSGTAYLSGVKANSGTVGLSAAVRRGDCHGQKRYFFPATTKDIEGYAGYRSDGADLIKEWLFTKQNLGFTPKYVYTKEDLSDIDADTCNSVLAHHETKAQKALDETVELAKAVEAALRVVDTEDTLIVVTSDHSHTMTYSGYSKRGSDILGFSNKTDNGSQGSQIYA
ncbi:hypothetical protein MSG28_010443 [Choristoneura fumiferana]|uniref:Uncharacterized protein n=1 Tax=Choristoneura fumiferana TaxID=7141 RepID=A0ACC0KLR7_CHOFU|nr:hypothetical protein MSG28_010443 [Choristoneura fumiferana]